MASKGTRRTVLNDRELEAVFATGQSVRPVQDRILPGANGRRTGRTVGPTRVLNGPTGQVSEVGPLGQSEWMSETGLD